MRFTDKNLMEYGSLLLKNYKFRIIFHYNSNLIVDENYYLQEFVNDVFLNRINQIYNELSFLERKILYMFYFKDNLTSIYISYNTFVSRSTVYRIKNKALIKLSKNYIYL